MTFRHCEEVGRKESQWFKSEVSLRYKLVTGSVMGQDLDVNLQASNGRVRMASNDDNNM